MKVVGIIPARYNSSRFPGKPLADILGKPMVQHVFERVRASQVIDDVVVATDHEDIKQAVLDFGGRVVMTSEDHETGSDRIAEVVSKIEGDIFVNIQGDEPLIHTGTIDKIVETALENPESVVTAKTKLENMEDVQDPNIVKVIADRKDSAIYFSRSQIPYNRSKEAINYYKHLGIYSYPREVITQFVDLPQSPLERVEVLEQLRLLENGYSIKVIETSYDAVGVDVPGDIQKVENIMGVTQ
ncbi:3-deoxy-manno-octulosonate cytidylyltransferase [Halobacillus litoralis]|uniref:3-deoxy-manno-octulosonate cytidylyltransferase n=1 Tax=Halobacillus litoralis TaxID=45668 RepID=A0A845DUD5_9BACI|nr:MULTISPECIES: 3-deoxy-manno-octulosonate cytidylyltransferase [Halobacillus]MYL20125.1 3-deoxy-manno-octulosonate cytidylyltransferase [Halobacillus litoralis]MYL30755.1 3-deoxy-manno-octulosonate cytidylyltransferase [Halobacillus halophilus]